MIRTLLLLALPASGKSEVRRYLSTLDAARRREELHLDELLQLDDYPYVHVLRRVDQERVRRGEAPLYFHADDRPMKDPRDWGTLIALVNEDFEAVRGGRRPPEGAGGAWLADRLDAARRAVGAPPVLAELPAAERAAVAASIDPEARALAVDLARAVDAASGGPRTLVLEFARGGAEGSSMPLPAPYGYKHSLGLLAPSILENAAILYIWVTPEESRRKNEARADPNDPGSILHHGVPEAVMRGDYGCDDIDWLLGQSDRPGTVRVEAHGRVYHLPAARLDNRVDMTSFLRADAAGWAAEDVRKIHEGLRAACDHLERASR
ncbi:MAG: hypothetical protein IT372_18990 [Polyangiaceae bacterium]|nr:hypothetical protein [Polyangiaceae bacterium]